MADDDKKAADQRQQQAATQKQQQGSQRSGSAGDLKFSNEPDKRSPEQQQEDIAAHNERMTEQNNEALDEKLGEFDPEKLGYRGLGGMDIIDTRNAQPRFAPVASVNDANLAQKKQLAKENAEVQASPNAREEQQQRNQGRDDTARAEVAARR